MSIADRKLTVLAPEALDAYWPIVGDLLDRALTHSEDELSAEDIRGMVRRAVAFILVIVIDGRIRAAGAVEIVQYPRYKVASIIAVGGDKVFLRRDEFAWVCQVARDMGCAKVQTYCRPSMARLLGKLGMREAYRVMRCDL